MRAADSYDSKQFGAGSATVILAILLILLVAVTAYLLVTYYSQNSAMEALEQELSRTQYDLRRANSSLERAEQDKQSADRELSGARSRLQELRNAGDDRLNALRKRIQEYGQQQQKNETALREQSRQLAECESLAGKLEAADKRITELAALGREFEECTKSLADSQDALQATQQDARKMEQMASRLAACEQQLAQAAPEPGQESVEKPRAEADSKPAATSRGESEQAAERLAGLEKQVSELQADLQTCRKTQQADADDAATQQADAAQCAALKKQAAQLEQDLEICRNELQAQGGKATEEEVAEVKTAYESLITDLKQEVRDKEVTIERFRDEVKIQILGQVLFPSGSSHITLKGKEVLKKLRNTLTEVKYKRIYVIGHTDDVDIKAAFLHWVPSNWELSAKRAASVVRYLIEADGVRPDRLAAVGRSYYEPVGDNDTPEGRAQNRRVEIVVSNDLHLE